MSARKTPISYYGGKQRMASKIIKLIPEHKQYVEPFFGGGAVFFKKEPSEVEVINDLDERVINFYRVMKTDFEALNTMIQGTLHSEADYRRAKYILSDVSADKVSFAWAFWVQTNMSFGNKIHGAFAFGNSKTSARSIKNKKHDFPDINTRFDLVQIFCRDAIRLIKLKDKPNTFIYCDPPYASSECGHYAGYTMEDFEKLLTALANLKHAKFLLSSYPETVLMDYRKKHGWYATDTESRVAVDGRRKGEKLKTECLTANYDFNKK